MSRVNLDFVIEGLDSLETVIKLRDVASGQICAAATADKERIASDDAAARCK